MAAMALGLLLGLRHATDADHVVAVSAIVSEERNPWRGIWVGASWGLGHTAPLLVVGTAILLLKETVSSSIENVAPTLEFGVGIMLAALGIQVLWRLRKKHLHIHEHTAGKQPHLHVHAHAPERETAGDPYEAHGLAAARRPMFRLKSFLVGVVHGLAGSAAVMLLLLPGAPSFGAGVLYVLVFGLGTIVAMAGITLLLGFPFAATSGSRTANYWVTGVSGTASLCLGAVIMSEIAFGVHLLPFLPE